MPARCPECYADLPEDADWVCPACGYTLRTPTVSKVGIAFMVLGLVLLGAFIIGPDQVIPRDGSIPFELVDLAIAGFPFLVLGTFGLGMLLTLAGALKLRGERRRAAA